MPANIPGICNFVFNIPVASPAKEPAKKEKNKVIKGLEDIKMALKKLFTPYQIGTVKIPNRLVVPAMVTNYCTIEGEITERYMKYIEEKAKGGWGLIITEDYAVQQYGKGYQRIPGLYKDELIEGNKQLTTMVHKYESKIFCQMYHPGRQTTRIANEDHMPVAPSAIECPLC